jgi:general secretion pathway protein I
MSKMHYTRGFTLIEVLVALAITAVALAALTRAVSQLDNGSRALNDRILGDRAAANAWVLWRITAAPGSLPPTELVDCPQAHLQLRCRFLVSSTDTGPLWPVRVQAEDAEGRVLGRVQAALRAP